ncbi:MAG: hypothetical protein ACO3ZY_04460 [Phycisphaerales bacterium]
MTTSISNRPPLVRTARKVLLIGLLASVAVLVGLGLMLLLGFDDMRFGPGRSAASACVTGLWSMVGFAVLTALDVATRSARRFGTVFAWIAGGMVTVAALCWLATIWSPNNWLEEQFARAGGIATIWTFVSLLPLGFISSTPLPRWARLLALPWGGYVIWLAVMATSGILELRWIDRLVKSMSEEVFFRIHGSGAIFAFCGLVVVAVVQRARGSKRNERGDTVPWRLKVPITCPRCGLAQELPVGGGDASRCGRCRLRIVIEVEEPRCGCGYALYRLAGATCPECGREVPEEDRWLSGRIGEPEVAD